MANNFNFERSPAQYPDLKADNKLTQEAHALLDDAGSWRPKLRDPDTFIHGLEIAEKSSLDENRDGKITSNEMLDFVNDGSQNALARQSVEILRENPALFAAASGKLDDLRVIVSTGTIKGVDRPDFVSQQALKNVIAYLKGIGVAAGIVAASGGLHALLGGGPPAWGAAAIFGVPLTAAIGFQGVMGHLRTQSWAKKAQENRTLLDNYNLFNEGRRTYINDFLSLTPENRRNRSATYE